MYILRKLDFIVNEEPDGEQVKYRLTYELDKFGKQSYVYIDKFDPSTGEVKPVKTAKIKLLEPRTLILRYYKGSGYIIRDICDKCYNKHTELKEASEKLYDILKNLREEK
jgi:hypothetical protein